MDTKDETRPADSAAATGSGALTWSEKPPDREGWFWLRGTGVPSMVVLVFKSGTTLAYYMPGLGQFSLYFPPPMHVEFSGPVPEPVEKNHNQ